ncbi:GNAT family N-acetyltransferase [Streptomyces sp. NPDC004520]|uniref:GNAT family N-acetyltransferase n=1 Tax=Streptomyces sp. NPDC004520 TaxID=3364702 RepID=UPI0036C8221B
MKPIVEAIAIFLLHDVLGNVLSTLLIALAGWLLRRVARQHRSLNMPHVGIWPTLIAVTLRSAGKPISVGPRAHVVVRRFVDGDSVEELTDLLHRAYADHAAAGRVFFASYQSARDTAHRLGNGECWVALRGKALVGTVTVMAPYGVPEGYPAPAGAGSFWQLAVDPEYRGTGLGQRLLALAEERIAALGSAQVVIDTSAEAVDLVGWYRRRGYVPVGSWRWGVTNYESVVLLKELTPDGRGR